VERDTQVCLIVSDYESLFPNTSLQQGEIYVKFDDVESAKNAVQGLNGRWFGGKQVTAAFISDAMMQAHQ